MNQEYWNNFIKNAPEDVFKETMTYWSTLKLNFNLGIVSLSKEQLNNLIFVQKAFCLCGIDKETFDNVGKESLK